MNQNARVYSTPEPGWVTRREAAARCGVSTRTISRWRAADQIRWRWELRDGRPTPVFHVDDPRFRQPAEAP